MTPRFNPFFTAIILSSLMTACGGGGGGGGSAPPPADPVDPMVPAPMNPAPTVNVLFPNQASLTNSNFITIRGTASDDSGTVSVTVNGEAAETDDDFATWEAFIELALGENSYNVVATDGAGNTSNITGQVTRALLFGAPSSLEMDETNNRVLVSDELLQTIFTVDLTSGERSILFNNSGLALDLFVNPTDVYLDEANNRLLVLDFIERPVIENVIRETAFDPAPKRLWEIDLETGERTVLIDSIPNLLPHPLFDSANRQLIGSFQFVSIGTINVDTGNIAAANVFQSAPNTFLAGVAAIDYDVTNNRLFGGDLIGGNQRVISTPFGGIFQPITEISSNVFPNNSDPLFRSISLLNYDADRNRVLTRNLFLNLDQLVAVDEITGERTVFMSPSIPAGQNPIGSINDLVINGDSALMVDFVRDSLINVDLDTGNRTTLSENRFPIQASEDNIRRTFNDFVLDEANNRALVSDQRNNAIVAIDLDTGVRSTVASLSSETGIPAEIERASNGDIFVLDADANRIVMLTEGSSDETVLATDASFTEIASFALDEENSQIILFDRGSNSVGIVDLVNNTAGVVAENVLTTFPPDPNTTIFGTDLAYDAANNRALVVSGTDTAVFSVDLELGTTAILSDNNLDNQPNTINRAAALKMDLDNNRVLLSDIGNRSISAIDLDTGERTVVFRSQPEEDVAETDDLLFPLSLAIDSNGNIVVLNILTENSLDLIDPTLDEKVIISR